MHRLLVESGELEKEAPTLSREAANHLKVLRPKDGEEIELFDGKGRWRVYRYDAKILGLGVGSRCTEEFATSIVHLHLQPTPLTLFACVTKGSRWDWTIEKATELGVTRIVPVISERTIVRIVPSERAAKRERWMRIAEEAARQSDAKWLPEICEAVDFAEALTLVKETQCLVGALTNPPPKTIGEVLIGNREQGIGNRCGWAVFVGPEGDFTPDELAALLKIATPVSFGSTILRAETAAIYGVSVLKAFLDVQAR